MTTGVDRSVLSSTIAFINGKGGVGKTTLTANAAGLLALSGWRTLAVDLDHQGNLGRDLGYRGGPNDDNGRALAKAMSYPDEVPTVLRNVRENLDVLVGGAELEQAAAALSSRTGSPKGREDAQLAIARLLSHVAADYDVVLLDCPPANDIIQTAAVAAAHYVIIPTKGDDGSLDGLKITTERFDQVQALNPDLDLLGIVIFDSSKSAHRVRESFTAKAAARLAGDDAEAQALTRSLVFESYVSHSEAVAYNARSNGKLVHEIESAVRTAPKWYELLRAGKKGESVGPASASSVAESLQAVTGEIIERLNAKRAEEAVQAQEEVTNV